MKVASAVFSAFGMFSRVPLPKATLPWAGMEGALAAFPLVGIAQGALLAAWGALAAWADAPAGVVAAVFTVLPLAFNGGIHLDGLCDTADALASCAPRERRLQILKDPHAGAFGVMAVVACLLLQFALFESFVPTARSLACLPCLFALSRALSGLAVLRWPKARPDGLARGLADGAPGRAPLVALSLWAAAAVCGMVLLAGVAGALCAVSSLCALAAYRRMALRAFGGVTGDLAGWFLQWTELAMLAVLVGGGLLWSWW